MSDQYVYAYLGKQSSYTILRKCRLLQLLIILLIIIAEEEVEESPEEPEPESEVLPEPEPEPETEPVYSLVENSEPDNELKLENYEIKDVLSETKEENQAKVEGCSARRKDVICEKGGLNTQQV